MENFKMTSLKNPSGFSVSEILVATAIAGIAAMVALQVSGVFNSKMRSTDQSRASSYFNSDLLARSKRMLLSVQDTSSPPKNTLALCNASLIRSSTQSAGVGLVEVNVNSNAARRVFTDAVWSQHFGSDWIPAPCPANAGPGNYLKKCFSLNPASSLRQSSAPGSRITSIVSITPVSVDPELTQGVFKPLSETAGWIDAKKIVYDLNSRVLIEIPGSNANNTPEKKEISANGMVWSAEVSHCDLNNLKVAISGSGLGDWQGNTVFNTTRYDEATTNPLMINVQKRVITEGEIISHQRDDYMKAQFDKNVEVACSEVRFRCADDSGTARQYSPEIGFRTNVRYFPNNNVNSRVQNTFSVRPQIVHERTRADLLANRRQDISFRAAGQPFVERNNHMYQLDTTGALTTNEFFVGGALTRTAIDVNIQNANPVCQRVCQNPNTKYHLNFMATLWGFHRNGTDYVENLPNLSRGESPIAVGCNACFMKSCARFGVKVFGAMDQQPDEPLDAGIPECAPRDSGARSRQVYTPSQLNLTTPNQCVSVKVSGNTPVFNLRNCSDRLPVMCFAFGRFLPGRDLRRAGEFVFPEVAFDDAQKICFEQGAERGLRSDLSDLFRTSDVTNLNAELATINRMSPGAQYNIVNTANQGLFLSPQNTKQWNLLIDGQINPKQVFNDPRYPAIAGTEYWIALRTTSSGHTAPEIPVAQARQINQENYAIYWLPTGRPKITEYTMPATNDAIQNGSGVGVLVNHVKYRGLVFVPPSTAIRRPVLCRQRNSNPDYFIAPSAVISDNAAQACANNGGVFAAPTTPLAWAHAFKLLAQASNQDSPSYSFPQPTTTTGAASTPLTAWVALQANVNGQKATNWRLPENHTELQSLDSTAQLLAAKQVCDVYETDYQNYLTAKAVYDQKVANGDPNPGSAPTSPRLPIYTCPVDVSGSDERNARGEFLPAMRSGRRATSQICESNQTGEWSKTSIQLTNCGMNSKLIKSSDLRSNYMNTTKWLILQSQMGANEILWIPR